jgi:Leucine-rich repeat (LRR) protein
MAQPHHPPPQYSRLHSGQNCIASIEGVKLGKFNNLKEINLSDNFLTRVRCLRKELNGNMECLRKLDLSGNYIVDIPLLSECKFAQLDCLDLRNNNCSSVFAIEKVNMSNRGRTQSTSRYEIRVSTEWPRDKLFIYGYRDKSRHKLSVKIEPVRERLKRETVQKGRRLILD